VLHLWKKYFGISCTLRIKKFEFYFQYGVVSKIYEVNRIIFRLSTKVGENEKAFDKGGREERPWERG